MKDAKSKTKEYWNESSSTFDLSYGHVIANRKEETIWKSILLYCCSNLNEIKIKIANITADKSVISAG
jgi:hypothetical protein